MADTVDESPDHRTPELYLGYNAQMIRDLNPTIEAALREADWFFMGEGPVHLTLHRLARRLAEHEIDYAVIGAIALFLHGYRRETVDIDLLMTSEGLEVFNREFVGLGYVATFAGAKKHFRDAETGVKIDIVAAGEYPGDGKVKPVAFPNPRSVREVKNGIQVVRFETLLELKLASGISASARLKDLADVQEVIKALNLPRSLADALDPYVRDKYLSLWDGVERDRLNQSRPDYEQ